MIEVKVVAPAIYQDTTVTLQLHKDGSVTWKELTQDNWSEWTKRSPLTPENMDPNLWYEV